ncbi:hypothetical protein NQ176_g8410 [Zarea fungicola]|uniref:Uncharacterized protein n=1 Tax=Zarea fungicola TaxID=93591 RepID=A0ACC1MSI5_9HYPO|nr:hypothetical protein NQ176_g8410 [Lecanicillium fungicola]
MSEPSTPERTIARDWEEEAYSPESLGQAPETTSPIRRVEAFLHGARIKRFQFTKLDLQRYFQNQDPYSKAEQAAAGSNHDDAEDEVCDDQRGRSKDAADALTRLCNNTELAVKIGKYLSPDDIVSLFSISRGFNEAISNYMSASVNAWIAHKAPESAGEEAPAAREAKAT